MERARLGAMTKPITVATTTAASSAHPQSQPPTSQKNMAAAAATTPETTAPTITTTTYLGDTRRQSPMERSRRFGMGGLRLVIVVIRGQCAHELGDESCREQDRRSDRGDQCRADGAERGDHGAAEQIDQ